MKLKVQAEAADADVTNVADDEDAPPGEDLLLTLIRHHLWQSTPLLSQLFFLSETFLFRPLLPPK